MIPYFFERVIGNFFPIAHKQVVGNHIIQAALQLTSDSGVQRQDLIGKSFDGHSVDSSCALGGFYQPRLNHTNEPTNPIWTYRRHRRRPYI